MPKWSEYKEVARSRGALALELYACVSEPVGTPEQLQAALPEHLAYIGGLEEAGKLAMSGPMSDLTGDDMQGMGLVILRAESFEEALSLAENDPMHTSGARQYTLRRWLVNEGRLTVTVGLSRAGSTLS